jgi:HAD superfamily hydrolase (TIGR01509 family)
MRPVPHRDIRFDFASQGRRQTGPGRERPEHGHNSHPRAVNRGPVRGPELSHGGHTVYNGWHRAFLMTLKALIFDCDGVLADTERDGHRVAFNRAFAELGIEAEWSVTRYAALLRTAGGKERMRRHFEETGWPRETAAENEALITRLHARKSRIFRDRIARGALSLRPGVNRLVDEAIAAGVKLAVCSTSARASVLSVMDLMGPHRRSRFDPVLAGDEVSRKKPDPEIYRQALQRLRLNPAECLVIEDSAIGLQAALGARIACIITTSAYTVDDDFTGASRVVAELGDPPAVAVTLEDLRTLTGSRL